MAELALLVDALRFFAGRGEASASLIVGLMFRDLFVSMEERCGSLPSVDSRVDAVDAISDRETGSQSIQWSHSLSGEFEAA